MNRLICLPCSILKIGIMQCLSILRNMKGIIVTTKEREKILKAMEMAWSFPSQLKNRIHARAKTLGMSDSDFIIRSVEKALGDKTCTAENLLAAKEAIREQFIGETCPF